MSIAKNEKIDVQKIVEELKKEIEQKGLKNDIPAFTITEGPKTKGVYDNRIQAEINYLKATKIDYYHELSSYNGRLLNVKIFMKRVLRKLVKFIGVPIIDDINDYNNHIVSALSYTNDNMKKGLQLEERVYNLEAKLLQMNDTLQKNNTEIAKKDQLIKKLCLECETLQLKFEKLTLQGERENSNEGCSNSRRG